MKAKQPKLKPTSGKCRFDECPMTLVYPVGSEQYICWLHILTHFPELIPLIASTQ